MRALADRNEMRFLVSLRFSANKKMKVGLFILCDIDQFYSNVGIAMLELLEVDVRYPKNPDLTDFIQPEQVCMLVKWSIQRSLLMLRC